MNPWEQKLMKIQAKIFQVLRIKKQLDARIIEYLKRSSSSNNPVEIYSYLSSLVKNYEREKNVFNICDKGLVEALAVLEEVKEVINSFESFPQRLKSNLKSKIPIIGKKDRSPQSLIPLIKTMYSYITSQIYIIKENFDDIKKNVSKQFGQVLEVMKEVKGEIDKGDNYINISENKALIEIEKLREQEILIIDIIKKSCNSKKGKIIKVMYKINIKLSQNQRLLKWQGALQIAPLVNAPTAAISIFLGPQIGVTYFVAIHFVKYSPIIAILVKELAILSKKPAARAKEFAVIRAKAAALGLQIPVDLLKEAARALKETPRPAFAYAK